MKWISAVLLIILACGSPAAPSEPPSFRDTASPSGWSATRDKTGALSQLRTETAVALPVEAVVRFRASDVGSLVSFSATGDDGGKTSLLEATVRLLQPNSASVIVRANGDAMEADSITTRTWSQLDRVGGSVSYAWRYPRVKNLWEDRDRREIGHDYAQLVSFADKVFTLRFVLAESTRQIWLDDRLVAEARLASPTEATFALSLQKGAEVLSVQFQPAAGNGLFTPLSLAHYSHAKAARKSGATNESRTVKSANGIEVPVLVPDNRATEIDLGESLYRYRLAHGGGPDAPYVNAKHTWPNAFQVDPARFSFRVPYRHYQNVWLLAWVDDDKNAVPRGTFRFYRADEGFPSGTDFEISEAAIAAGRVTRLAQKTADGKPLYLVRVPVDTDGLQAFRHMAHQFLECEFTKPVTLSRGYPDPIYYGYHPAGPPSSVHIVGITLEEAPFGYEVKPARVCHVFERPENPGYTVAITNASTQPIEAVVTMETRSFDGEEKSSTTTRSRVGAGSTADAALSLDLKKNGWHELKVRVEAGGVTRANTLSLVVLPPNTRTYGNAPNETRFGLWTLWGHFVPLRAGKFENNERYLAMLRKLGMRKIAAHRSFVTADMLKRHHFLPNGPHTDVNVFHRLNENDPEAVKAMVEAELKQVGDLAADFGGDLTYWYGGEWHISREIQYAPWPRYTGEGDRDLTEAERKNAARHVKIFTAIGTAMRERFPKARLYLQWGAPQGTLAYLKHGIAKEIVDSFGMDAPMFELLPEVSNVTGSINNLWWLRAEAEKLGWPRLPIGWCEGPFFPTNPGALTEKAQMDHQVRYWLLGMAYGIDDFQAGAVAFEAGNYYSAEHYGAGLFHRTPLENPKPAVAAIATATTMLCGADPAGAVDTGSLTTYCMAFERPKTKEKVFALWRVNGTVRADLKVVGAEATLTDAMGNATTLPVQDGVIQIRISPTPVWLTGVAKIEAITTGAPRYEDKPASVLRPLAEMTAKNWTYDGSEDHAYAHNHFAIKRVADPMLKPDFSAGEPGHEDAVAITLPVQGGDRPLANRYGALRAKEPVVIPGQASALGIWIKGNSSWGRVVYQVRDANGELWTSNGTKDDWNCDDTHAWSYVSFDGWRYVRFPLPGNEPWDAARSLETTWWGHRDGDGIVDLPLRLEKIYVEARNEAPVLGRMTLVPVRGYKLAGLAVEYESEQDATPAAIARHKTRKPLPDWSGPSENLIAKLAASGTDEAPSIKGFEEPHHWNDGRRMIIHFEAKEGRKYNLYLSRYDDGRGAELLKADVKNDQLVTGMRPAMEMYLFLTSVGGDKRESKPSKPYKLITKDNFAEK